MSTKTIYRQDYQPYSFEIDALHLDIALYDDYAFVHSRLNGHRKHPGPLRLNGVQLELIELRLNNQPLSKSDYRLEQETLLIDERLVDETFVLEVETKIYPQNNTTLSGLYRSRQLFCTQCEAEGFRRITFFPDRPDVLTTYTTRISADKAKYPLLLSNGNLIEQGEMADGRHWVVWHDPFKKPCYLFALVAGQLACVEDEFVTCSGKKVTLRIYVERGNEHQCQHAMDSLKKAMRWDEQYFGREYDLELFMIVAVSDFNMGAMENKGLNIFNAKYILASAESATDDDYANIESVVAHEYFHNWTGNRVTCRDWFQLSLKEGLTVFRDQEFSRDMNSRDVNRILDVKKLRASQFPEDAGAMAHPVRPESYQEINNFYTSTIYNKGAEVIRMQHTLLGPAGFRRGMDLYFKRHDGQAVTIDDFITAMADANQCDLNSFQYWYSQAGTPQIKVKRDYKEGRLTLSLEQTCRPTPECNDKKPFPIPLRLALFNPEGQLLKEDTLLFKDASQTVHYDHLHTAPILSLLRDFSAPVQIEDDLSSEELMVLLRYETDGFSKWEAAQRLAIRLLINAYHQAKEPIVINPLLISAYQAVLSDSSLDNALRSELLNPPSYEEVAAYLQLIDVTRLEEKRDTYRAALASSLYAQAKILYETLWQKEDNQMHAHAFGPRRLRNRCLWLMMKADEKQSLHLCQRQFNTAKTMTDTIASLALIVNSANEEIRKKALADFYHRWKQHELVLDKWFAIQACCEQPGTLKRVQALLEHPAFNIQNPNKVYALVGSFCFNNPRHFHALDGRGYDFLTTLVLKLDKLNPQVASRMITPFTRWQYLDKPRQQLIHQHLNGLAAASLSRDVGELVTKSLAAIES